MAGLYVLRLYYIYPRTDDAYVRANVVGVAPHVSGPIVELPIRDNQHVAKGALLFVVDPRPYQSALERAEASLTLTNLQINALQDAIHSAEARQQQLEADAAYDKQYLNRIVPLLARHFVTANDVFNARSRLAAAEAAVDSAHNEVRKSQNELGQYGDFNARRKAAEAALYYAQLNVQYCYVRAPFDAYVTNLNIAVGQYANEGKQVVSLVDNRVWYVIANFRENFLDHIRPGMRVEVYLLSYPNRRFLRAECRKPDGRSTRITAPPSPDCRGSSRHSTGCGCRSAFRSVSCSKIATRSVRFGWARRRSSPSRASAKPHPRSTA